MLNVKTSVLMSSAEKKKTSTIHTLIEEVKTNNKEESPRSAALTFDRRLPEMAEVAEENDYVNAPPTSGPNRGMKCSITKRVVIGILTAVLLLVAIIGIRLILHVKQLPRNLATTVTTSADSDTSCPFKHCDTGWELNGTNCYYFSTTKSSWDQSRKACQDKGGDLGKIDSREEQRFLFNEVRSLMRETDDSEDKFWIGLTDAENEGEWRWVDNTPLNQSLSFWFETGRIKEPDNWTDNNKKPEGQDCVRMGEMGQAFEEKSWFDKDCSIEQRFICEKEPNKSLS